jgi:transcriptional regulator with XRE-family HTH domain
MVRERGSGKTPARVIELLKKEVSEKSLLAVSKSTGLGLAAIGRYLKGIGEPTTATLEKLADYFKVSVQELRGENREHRLVIDDPDNVIMECALCGENIPCHVDRNNVGEVLGIGIDMHLHKCRFAKNGSETPFPIIKLKT